ncbi:hypothetical protein [Rhizobium dioscoreae]|uniref:hypothetical protein n=1 Tax=Rhizobium dioscoreae TaxID=2653122 RepID=UPI0012606E67|nr:hypothetical protein [Rhizobium dioscoreae]
MRHLEFLAKLSPQPARGICRRRRWALCYIGQMYLGSKGKSEVVLSWTETVVFGLAFSRKALIRHSEAAPFDQFIVLILNAKILQ